MIEFQKEHKGFSIQAKTWYIYFVLKSSNKNDIFIHHKKFYHIYSYSILFFNIHFRRFETKRPIMGDFTQQNKNVVLESVVYTQKPKQTYWQRTKTEKECKEIVERLTEFEKYEIWVDYMVNRLVEKHRLTIINKGLPKSQYIGNLKGNKEQYLPILNVEIGYLSKHLEPMDFSTFISEKCFQYTHNGKNWKENGWAQEYFLHIKGIYYWLYTYQNKFTNLITK